MSSGGVFNVILNSGGHDKLLYASDFLKNRIDEFIKTKDRNINKKHLNKLPNEKYNDISKSILPSLNEIGKTHNMFINGAYKPSVILASEYIKVGKSSPKFGSSITYQMPVVGNFTNDCVLHIRLSNMSAKDTRDRIRYVAMLGHKLIKRVQLLVGNGAIVDEYDTDDYNAYYQYELDGCHKEGYLRNIGQELPNIGYLTSDPLDDMFSEYKLINDGNQTLKYSHGSVDLFVPLLFWFKDLKQSLPSLPWGQLQIRVELAEVTDIIGFANNGGGGLYNSPSIEFCNLHVNQLFTLPEIFNLYTKKFVFSLIRTHRAHKQVIVSDTGKNYQILLNNLKYPTEVLYFNFRPRKNLTLSQQWYKSCKLTEKAYKVPVMAKDPETVIVVKFAGFPHGINDPNTIYITSTDPLSTVDTAYNAYDLVIISGSGYNSTDILKNRYTVNSYLGTTQTINIVGEWDGFVPDSSTTFELYTQQLAVNNVIYYQEEPIVTEISLIIQGIEVYKNHAEQFYNSYLPTKLENVNIPIDCGQYMMPFCNKLYNFSPSGSLDFGLAREIYLNFSSDLIKSDYPVDLIVLARTINFLLIDGETGGLHLKYNM